MLSVERLSRSFGGVAALAELDLRVASGEVLGLIDETVMHWLRGQWRKVRRAEG